jgi:hypothetical protein
MPARREVIAPRGDKRYVRRDAKGRIVESDDMGRSLSKDRRRKASKASSKGQGDRGDRAPARKTAARKTTARKATARKATSRKPTGRKAGAKRGGRAPRSR